jgi:protein-tyrosine phosphatase
LVPKIIAGIRDWLRDKNRKERKGRVIMAHYKAGKGRSRTIVYLYLILEYRWTISKALTQFIERRIRPGFRQGVLITS